MSSKITCTYIFICITRVPNFHFYCSSLCAAFKSRASLISYKLVCSLNDISNSINNVLSSSDSESYGTQPLYWVIFAGGGYNRILLAFSSLLCGQMHLNVSTVSCLFRNRLEIGNTNASLGPITCRPALYPWLIVYASLLWITFK